MFNNGYPFYDSEAVDQFDFELFGDEKYDGLTKEELKKKLKEADKKIDTAHRCIEHLKTTRKIIRSDGKEVWVMYYDPTNPPTEDLLEEMSKHYLGGAAIFAIPVGTDIRTLTEEEVERLGVKPKDMNQRSREEYERMLGRT